MSGNKTISGFSKLSKAGKIKWIVENFFRDPEHVMRELKSYWYHDDEQQRLLDGFSENTICNFPMPYGVAPNFLINGRLYVVPMVIEESSVVAAASSSANFWLSRGGFKAETLGLKKVGQVHFTWNGKAQKLKSVFGELQTVLRKDTAAFTANMEKRGGGALGIELIDLTHLEAGYYQLKATFDTRDSMGANFINSVLEQYARTLERFLATHPVFDQSEREVTIIMSILSNYTPGCLARATVECRVDELGKFPGGMDAATFAHKFCKAVRIAHLDPHRATTHNKGIFNGIDAVVLATANDFRAVEACGHTYAARDGKYRSLSYCSVENGIFRFWLDIPLALGTVGGLTKLHPIARRSLELLGNPNAEELMMVVASAGLAQNFAALRSLVTTGIQQGHMKMHLANILNHFDADENEKTAAMAHFADKAVSFTAVREFLEKMRAHAEV
ncbi:MAG: hydroxymethylglutaryl-CoA reductase [Saprospiraceae bacterium]|nr:MAG: hydroxymethylglutaryl-CoA reductase [Saprospiraceae bacterium]